MTVLAAHAWRNNAELIADVARLYLDEEMKILDPTWGRGNWWKIWRPKFLVSTDIAGGPNGFADFTALPFASKSFDAVAYDPPYIAPGGRRTSTITEFNSTYGLGYTPLRANELQRLIHRGLDEAFRVTVDKGLVLVKCMDYITSGRLHTATYQIVQHADASGWRLVDVFYHISGVKAGPSQRQVHARRNHSTLLILGRR